MLQVENGHAGKVTSTSDIKKENCVDSVDLVAGVEKNGGSEVAGKSSARLLRKRGMELESKAGRARKVAKKVCAVVVQKFDEKGVAEVVKKVDAGVIKKENCVDLEKTNGVDLVAGVKRIGGSEVAGKSGARLLRKCGMELESKAGRARKVAKKVCAGVVQKFSEKGVAEVVKKVDAGVIKKENCVDLEKTNGGMDLVVGVEKNGGPEVTEKKSARLLRKHGMELEMKDDTRVEKGKAGRARNIGVTKKLCIGVAQKFREKGDARVARKVDAGVEQNGDVVKNDVEGGRKCSAMVARKIVAGLNKLCDAGAVKRSDERVGEKGVVGGVKDAEVEKKCGVELEEKSSIVVVKKVGAGVEQNGDAGLVEKNDMEEGRKCGAKVAEKIGVGQLKTCDTGAVKRSAKGVGKTGVGAVKDAELEKKCGVELEEKSSAGLVKQNGVELENCLDQYEENDQIQVVYRMGETEHLYEAKVITVKMTDGVKQYHVHYMGWNKRHDEWVDVGRIKGKVAGSTKACPHLDKVGSF